MEHTKRQLEPKMVLRRALFLCPKLEARMTITVSCEYGTEMEVGYLKINIQTAKHNIDHFLRQTEEEQREQKRREQSR